MSLFDRLFKKGEAHKSPIRKYQVGERVKHRKIASIVEQALEKNAQEIRKIKKSRNL
ncbi:hypothetical protein [Paenibacillus sp. GYB003]|uniref:hypothetical protein n=1 Tax=Paenibacillus sp. GYB003 TaxID=2994392 RepID=UPI002F9637F6